MYDVMSQIFDVTLQAVADSGWDVRIRGNLRELCLIKSRYGWAGDCLI